MRMRVSIVAGEREGERGHMLCCFCLSLCYLSLPLPLLLLLLSHCHISG